MATDAINALKARQAQLEALQANPLGDPGAQATLHSIQSTLNRKKASQLGALAGRASATGQAGFRGTFAGAAQQAERGAADAFSAAQGELALKIGEQARALGVDLAKEQADYELGARGQDVQKYGIDTERKLSEKKIKLSERELLSNSDLAREQLAEKRRQFDVAGDREDRDFGLKSKLAAQEVGLKERELGQGDRKISLAEQEDNFQRLKGLLALAIQGHEIGYVPGSAISAQFNALGLPARNRPQPRLGGRSLPGQGDGGGTARPGLQGVNVANYLL